MINIARISIFKYEQEKVRTIISDNHFENIFCIAIIYITLDIVLTKLIQYAWFNNIIKDKKQMQFY